MELQHSRYGEPGTVTWFAKFRKDEEYLDGKFPTAQVYSQTELKEMRKAKFEKNSDKTREQLMEEAQNEQEVEPIPTSLPQPEWIDAMTEGTGTGASSSGDHQGAFPAEQATVLEPIPVKNRPILFTDENDLAVWNTQRKGVDYDRLRYESKFWPKWYKDENKTLVDHFPEAKFFDEKRWLWYGQTTPKPRDGILRCNVPYLLNAGGGVYHNACYRGKWFLAPAHPEDCGCPEYMSSKDYADMEWYGRWKIGRAHV